MTYNPSKLYNFEAGYLAENGPADITIFDAKADRLVDSHFASKAANSPFIGETLKGQVNIPSARDKLSTKTRWDSALETIRIESVYVSNPSI